MCVIMAFPYDGYSVHGRAGTEAQDHRPTRPSPTGHCHSPEDCFIITYCLFLFIIYKYYSSYFYYILL